MRFTSTSKSQTLKTTLSVSSIELIGVPSSSVSLRPCAWVVIVAVVTALNDLCNLDKRGDRLDKIRATDRSRAYRLN